LLLVLHQVRGARGRAPFSFMQFIAYLTGNPAIQGYHRRDFKWSPEHGCYIYLGRTFDEKEFNVLMPAIWKKYREHFPQFKILDAPKTEPVVAAPAPVASLQIDVPQAPVEITVEAAEAVLQRLAPEKLRKQAPRPQLAATVPR
jgi:hypothetical protein